MSAQDHSEPETTPRPLRVVLLVTDLQRGGTPQRLAALARGLKAAGVDVHVGCLANRGPVQDDLDAAGIPNFACRARSVRSLGALLRLLGHLRRIQPDVIHATLTHANVAARLVGGYLGIPVLTSTATIEVERRWHRWIERRTARWDHGHIVNSRALADHVERTFRVPRERIYVVPAALERFPALLDRSVCRERFGIKPDEFAIVWAGRFDPVKRLDVVLDVARRSAGRPWRFVLAGDGPQRPVIESALRGDPQLAQRIALPGWLDDLSPLFSAADVLLFPSLTEGTPNVVLQALAAGVPIVGGDIPALRGLAGEENRILLVGDGAAEFTATLERLADDSGLRAHLAAAGAAWARGHLDHARLIAALCDVYTKIADRGSSLPDPRTRRA